MHRKNLTRNQKQMKTAYLIGIKGVGMTALAKYLSEAGFVVEGSDNDSSYVTDEILAKNKIKVLSPFNKENLNGKNPDIVIISAAYGVLNPEVEEAKKRHLNIQYYSETLGDITAEKKLIAVSGIHGKTTTTALIALLLEKMGLDPSYLIGAANVPVLGSNAHFGNGDYFVLEADEYRQSPENLESKFLCLSPKIAIISSIELDHPDIFESVEDVYRTFYKFAGRVHRDGIIILNIDYQKSKKLVHSLADRHFETYGFSDEADWRIVDVEEGDKTLFSVRHSGKVHGLYQLGVPGKHNILNATTAVILANILNLDEKVLRQTLADFKGVQRRFQLIAKVGDIVIIDDYAHHPTAIASTLEAVKGRFPNAKIWCIFQPHTFSRTKSLLKEFGSSFKIADKIIITDIYSSARESDSKVTSVDLVEEIRKNKGNVCYLNSTEKIKKHLLNFVHGESVILTIGAGDIYKLGEDLPKLFKK
jgi:UDP-N-acetylmuramate--alanine ligase